MANVSLTYGGYYFSTASATDNAADTPIKCAGTTTGYSTNGFTASTSNRLTYNGSTTRDFEILATLTVTCSGATESKLHLYKNGSLITGSTISRTIGPGSDNGAVAIACIVSLATSDYVELWCETNAAADDITIESGSVLAKVVG